MLEFRALGQAGVVVASITGLESEQVAAATAPFLLGEKPKAIFTAQTFSVLLDPSSVALPEHYRLRCWVYVLGSAAQLAPLSYLPVSTRPLKSRLWRLFGGEEDDSPSVAVNLPQSYPVARIALEVRGLLDETLMFDPPDP